MEKRKGSPLWVALVAVASLSAEIDADSTVVFNEIMYHPATREAELEWLELYNQMAVDMDISDWYLTGGVFFRFPEGTIVAGGTCLVVAVSPAALEEASGYSGALGPFSGRLDNSSERLELRNNSDRLMDSVRYRDRGGWPPAADGSGVSLAKIDPDSASADPANWIRSAGVGGTPGEVNFTSGGDEGDAELQAGPLRLAFNETLVSDAESWVEIINPGATQVSLKDLVLATSRAGASPYVLPDRDLGAGGYLVLAPAELGFGLRVNDKLFLYTPDLGDVVAAAVLEEGLRGRHPEARGPWLHPAAPTPGAANRFTLHDEVVINEIMYHARPVLTTPGTFDHPVILPIDAIWKFDQSGEDLGVAWREVDFPDGDWPEGRALFFNETSELPAAKNTPLELGIITYYFRTEFEFAGDPTTATLSLRPIVDDGAVFYLNGVEVYRLNMREGDVDATTRASRSVATARFMGPYPIPTASLVAGRNVLAVEVHQLSPGSPDVVFGTELSEVVTLVPPTEYAESNLDWLELYNRSAGPVDLSGWSLAGGIRYRFEGDTTLGAGEYIVVAADREALRTLYPDRRVVGDFEGRLSNRSDRLLLLDGNGNSADEVVYRDRGRWPGFADGFGASLELRDPHADNSKAESWRASDEGSKSGWRAYSYEGPALPYLGPTQWNEFVFGLFDAGEILIDDISVVEAPGVQDRQLIQDGGFDRDGETWRFLGTHGESRVVADPDDAENRVLHLIATGPTEHMHNHVETTYADRAIIRNGTVYRISFRARWLGGSRQLHTRLYFNRMPRTTVLEVPELNGTPGAENSVLEANSGPTFSDFGHRPVFPDVGEEVEVSTLADDPDGVASCTLWWSVDSGDWTSVPMALDPGGLHRGTIPGQDSATAIVQFYVEAEDARGATASFPPDGPESAALFKPADSVARPEIHNLRILMAPAVANALHANTNLMSNAKLPATVVYNERDVFYDVGVRLRGSERGRPENSRTGFHLTFDPDRLFRGVHRTLSIDRSGGWASFVPFGSQDEILIKHIATRAGGIPAMYDDLVYVIAPRRFHTSTALLMMGRFTSLYLDSRFENGSDGTKYTYELIYYPTTTTNGNPESLKRPLPDSVTGTDHRNLGDDKEAYRWFYIIENNIQRDDFSTLIQFAKTLGLSGAALDEASREVMDIDQWMRAFALYGLCGVGDTYLSGNYHNNIYYVRPSDNKVLVFPWDMDFAFVNSTTSGLWGRSHNLRKVIEIPRNRRVFYGHVLDIIERAYNSEYMAHWTAHYGALTRKNFAGFLNYIAQRRAFALARLPPEVPFEITTNGGENVVVDELTATIEGTGWIDIGEILVPELPDPPGFSWPALTGWQATVPLRPGENPLTFLAFDSDGNLMASDSIVATSTAEPPEEQFIRGDANVDGKVNIVDAVAVLRHLFRSRPARCEDAADANDDERLSLTDAIFVLEYLFRRGAEPAAPYPSAGSDPAGEDLGCDEGLEVEG